jgi:aminoglycoside phosphotransferase (APT) family kinase protein
VLDANRLGAYLAQHVPGLALPLAVRQFPSGFSNLTYLLTAGDAELVLRRPPFGTRPKTGHDMGREFRVLSALKRGFAECPRPVHYCTDESVIGAPFYVVERIRGIILRRDYPPELPATPGLVRAQQTALVDALADSTPRLPRSLAELADPRLRCTPGRGLGRPLCDAQTADAPSAAGVTWLASHLPPESQFAALIHNDYKLDNVVFDATAPGTLI